jgi:hypothetical protein
MSPTPSVDAKIATYVATVARKAFQRGYSTACDAHRLTINRVAQCAAAEDYVRSGFDLETVRRYHPILADITHRVAALTDAQITDIRAVRGFTTASFRAALLTALQGDQR